MSKTYIPVALRRQVYDRANGCCEYCLIPDVATFAPHEIDHIIAEKHGGRTELENLALSCTLCNKHKGSDLASVDPETEKIVPLYHPRQELWHEHFRLSEAEFVPLTPIGRVTIRYIRKFITYILSSNMAEFIPFLAMVFLKIPPALVILQILAIDLGTDMLPALALGAEKPEVGILLQPPRKKSKPLLDMSLLLRAYCFLGLLEGLAGMTGFLLVWWANGYGITELQAMNSAILAHSANATQMAIYYQATTVTLAAIVACQDGNVFACRSEHISIFRLGFFSNRLIWLGIAVEWALILSIIYVAPLQKIFATAPLSPMQWLMLLLCPPLILMADEVRKQFVHRIGDRVQPFGHENSEAGRF